MIHIASPSGTKPVSIVSTRLIGVRLRRGSGIAKRDCSVAMRMSQRAESCMPPARQ
jgi:hypothetical protein